MRKKTHRVDRRKESTVRSVAKPTAESSTAPVSANTVSPHPAIELQRSAGNHAVSKLVSSSTVQRQGTKTAPPKSKGSTFKDVFTTALSDPKVTLGILSPHVEAASQADRDSISSDAKLLKTARDKLGDDDYLTLLTKLRVFKAGKTAEDKKSHTKADVADKYIRDNLAAYVKEAVKAGRKVEGQVAVIDADDWKLAYDKEFGNDGEEATTNAFVDARGRIFLHKNRGNAGTMIHEGIHKYSNGVFLSTVKFNFNEGVTEYFTRKITSSLKPAIARGNYQPNYEFSKKFADYVGEACLAKGYFDGDVKGVKDAFKAKGKEDKDWDALLAATKDKKWADAEKILTAAAPAKPPAKAPAEVKPPVAPAK